MLFFMFGCLIANAGKAVSSTCPVEISPPKAVVHIGERFSANCSTSSDQVAGMGWEASNGGTALTAGVSVLELNIKSVTDWGLEPICFINLQNAEQCYQTLAVTVYKTPDSVSMSPPSPAGPLTEGENYRVQCDVVGVAPISNVSVRWHKGNEVFHTETFDGLSFRPLNETSVCNLTARRDDNGARIWCEAKLDLGALGPNLPSVKSQPHELNVLYPPAFASPANETLKIPAGCNFTLNCTATGNPMPVYSWHFPDSIHLMKANGNPNESTLSPSCELPGTYKCTASNAQGARTKYFTVVDPPRNHATFAALIGGFMALGVLLTIGGLLFVTKEGAFSLSKGGCEGCSLILKPSRVVVGFGESVSVRCEAVRPVRVLGWESAISATHALQGLSVQWTVDSLVEWIEEPICYGVFFTAPRQCEEKLNLVLYKTPDTVSIRPLNHTGAMVAGKEYQLLCEVQNIAPVQYLTLRWYRGRSEVYNHSFTELTSSSPVQASSILMVTPTKAENGAQYRCVAVLELGPEGPQPPPTVTSEPLNVSVHSPPAFLGPETEVVDYVADTEITLNCTATGYPAPVYSWQSSHPSQERMGKEAVLTSASLLPGTYTCTASNTLEKKSKRFIVKAKTKGV
ncbi:vascular cell adhesion protein 1-like [Brachionichthys hirsutus]|uniref:vascular cell adhesion protein 1-like n=1 Tax=Brachionichthys hirsutus TaxID=412623 RepID=UPI003604FA15